MDTKKTFSDFFSRLRNRGVAISDDQQSKIERRINEILNYEPVIGVFGKTGVGKSSLCNSLFGADLCPISDVEACTRETKDVIIQTAGGKGIKLLDVPGVGESRERDEEYAKLYQKLLPEIDVVLWILKGDDRAYASDEQFYNLIVKPHLEQGKPFFFVLNQVDKIEPFREWNDEMHEPGPVQNMNIEKKASSVADIFKVPPSKVIPVSANEAYNLTRLVDEMIFAVPAEKKITVCKSVNEAYRSDAAIKQSKESFFDIVGDFASDVVDIAKDFVSDVFDTITGGCYITTAVCKDSGKPDNCYELTQFRKFRDEWLTNQPDGKDLIKQYYDTAPNIVKLIDKQPNSHEIYDNLNEVYLTPCLHYIENEQYEKCKELYSDMVYNLYDESKNWN